MYRPNKQILRSLRSPESWARGSPSSNALKELNRPERKLGMSELGGHSFRRTFATGYLRSEGNLHKLQRTLGHASSKTTEIYLHMDSGFLSDGHKKFSSLNRRVA